MDYVVPPDLLHGLRAQLEEDRISASNSSRVLQDETDHAIRDIQTKVERLLDGYLAQDIEREVYLKKKSLEGNRTRLEHMANAWLEPMEKWTEQAENMDKIAQGHNLFAKKVVAKEIFGSNLLLTQKNVVVGYPENVVDVVVKTGENVVGQPKNVVVGGGQKQWTALWAARQMVSKKPLCIVMVDVARIELATSRM